MSPDQGRRRHRPAAVLGTGFLFALAACSTAGPAGPGSGNPTGPGGASPAANGGPSVVVVTLTDAGCAPDRSSEPAGPITFRVTNDGAGQVSEVELVQGDRILAEKENLAPGLSGTFTLELGAGEYTLSCPGAANPATAFTVTAGAATDPTPAPSLTALLAAATDGYATYVRDQVARLVTATRAFTSAVIAGNVGEAKALYGAARVYYERIEPVAESFGDLDPAIDGRIDDAATPEAFTGFHRIEQALWVTGDLRGMAPIARQLAADVDRLEDLVATETYQPAALANGAAELLDEIAASKVTGEEERYSRLDLLDFQANLDGARTAFELLEPALRVVRPDLAATASERFDAVQASLDPHRVGDGFALFTTLDDAQVRALAQQVDALAEPLSEVAAALVGS